MSARVIAWHFTGPTLRDGRQIPPVGEWLIHKGEALMCKSGLHASVKAFDALRYAPGTMAHLVECEDIVAEQADKLLCRRRKILASVECTSILRAFARRQALSVIHLWDAPDVVRRYLETGDESLRATACDAALDARDAARDAAWDAADAAWAAARAAAWDAADAAWAATRGAADAAWAAAALDAWDATRDAADAARAAAWDAANELLEALLLVAMGSKHPVIVKIAGGK